MVAAQKRAKLVVVEEGVSAAEVATDQVGAVVKGATVLDAVDTMATDFTPGPTDVLANEEFGIVEVELTTKQAKDLENKPGVYAVEDDEVAYAFGDFSEPAPAEDAEASAAIDEMMAQYADGVLEAIEKAAPEQAILATQRDPAPIDDIAFDESGHVLELGAGEAGADVAGIPPDKLFKLVRCVVSCAIEQFGGQVAEVSDDRITQMLAEEGLVGSRETAAAIRDYITCGLRIIYAPYAWRYSTGNAVRVAVVDTGITPRHFDLRVSGGASFVPGVPAWYDDHGHGTHVAGTIAAQLNGRGVVGVAPRAQLYAVKVLNRNGSGYTSWILNGLAWSLRNRMHIVNLSLGGGASTHDPNDYSRAYEQAGRILRRSGILAVAAAGNSGATANPYVGNPARCPSFMAVSAVDCNRRRAPFSSYGPQVEICAPGVGVWSTYPPNTFRQMSGTSMAAPHVAGVAALVKARRPYWHGDTIRVHLWRTAADLWAPGRDWFFGYGLVNALRAVL